MFLARILAVVFFLRTLAAVYYRKVEVRMLCRAANKRFEELDRLLYIVGYAFRERTALFSAISFGTFNNLGYETDSEGKRISGFCWNCPIGITVYIAGLPYVALGLELRGSALCIRQMQGARGVQPLEELRDWPELLVRACIVHAEIEGLSEVRIYKAEQDLGFKFPEITPQEGQSYEEVQTAHQNRMRQRYDRTAQKLKFKKKKRYYVWEISPQARLT